VYLNWYFLCFQVALAYRYIIYQFFDYFLCKILHFCVSFYDFRAVIPRRYISVYVFKLLLITGGLPLQLNFFISEILREFNIVAFGNNAFYLVKIRFAYAFIVLGDFLF